MSYLLVGETKVSIGDKMTKGEIFPCNYRTINPYSQSSASQQSSLHFSPKSYSWEAFNETLSLSLQPHRYEEYKYTAHKHTSL